MLEVIVENWKINGGNKKENWRDNRGGNKRKEG